MSVCPNCHRALTICRCGPQTAWPEPIILQGNLNVDVGYVEELKKQNASLVGALERVQQDINWMLNNQKFLNPDVFDYLEAALKDAGRKE